MPLNLPIAASGARSPEKRPRPVPRYVRHMIELMVRGKPGDDDCAPLSFIEAAAIAGIKPDIARKWLDRSEVRRLLRAERRVFREAICAGNESALARVRDKSENGMAVIGAVRVLEQLDEEDTSRAARGTVQPGLQIVIVSGPARPAPTPTIDVTPRAKPAELEPPAAPSRRPAR
jgi:hypothetical protein